MKYNISHGGWCPPGRRAEDGKIPGRYKLRETKIDMSEKAPNVPGSMRTEQNVRDSHGTLILTTETISFDRGTDWTIRVSALFRKPILILNPKVKNENLKAVEWIRMNELKILNIAGPSENTMPGIYETSLKFLDEMLKNTENYFLNFL